MIIQEAFEDELIDVKKYKKKRKYFFRVLEIFVILILTFLIPDIKIIFGLTIIVFPFLINIPNVIDKLFVNKAKHALKNKLLDSEIMKYSSKIERKNIAIEFFICIIIYYMNLCLIEEISEDKTIIICIEIIIALIIAIRYYIKFIKIDIYTNKAKLNKQKLKGLKNFLKDNSLIENRKAIEIYIWEDYLIFCVLLGINHNIPDEIKINLSNIKEKRGKYYDYYENKYY